MSDLLNDIYKEALSFDARVARSYFYIADLVTGAEIYDELILIRNQVTEILNSPGFNLIKWFSNHPGFLNSLQKEKLIHSDSDSAKALGIH